MDGDITEAQPNAIVLIAGSPLILVGAAFEAGAHRHEHRKCRYCSVSSHFVLLRPTHT
jgi:hypothetical protein